MKIYANMAIKWTLSLIFFAFFTLVAGQENAQVPAELIAKALNFAVSPAGSSLLGDENDDSTTIVQNLKNGSVETLYSVANAMNHAGDHINSVLIWHALADGPGYSHILSMVRLGFSYVEEDKAQAIKYFVQAGEEGPHQGALYNAGLTFLQLEDLTRALAYIRAAATLANEKDTEMYATPQLTETATRGYDILSDIIMTDAEMNLQDMINIFGYASINDFPIKGSEEDELWDAAMVKLIDYTTEVEQNLEMLVQASEDLVKLQKSEGLSKLQVVLLKNIQVEILKLVKKDEL